jgi:hypothetical protein
MRQFTNAFREEGAADVRAYQRRELDPQAGTSPAGLTRGSIQLRKTLFAKRMDCRVKPGNDGLQPLPVTRGLDPRVHRSSQGLFAKLMDTLKVIE